jgi:hypothetical protein
MSQAAKHDVGEAMKLSLDGSLYPRMAIAMDR